jgi:hypothetical protein
MCLDRLSPRHGTWSRRRRARSGGVSHASEPLKSRLKSSPLSLPKPPWPRPSPRTPLEASPSPILRGMSRPRFAALRLAAGRSGELPRRAGGAGRGVRKRWPPARRAGERATGGAARKGRLNFLLCCRCCQAPLKIFSFLHSLGAVSHRPDRSGGFLWRWDLSSPTTFYPCGLHHPSPDALCVLRRELEGLWEATPSIRRRLYGPGSPTGRLHQHQV